MRRLRISRAFPHRCPDVRPSHLPELARSYPGPPVTSRLVLRQAARRHWETAGGGSRSTEQRAEAIDRLCIHLRANLGRWIGADGYQALHDRALVMTQATNPALRSHAFDGGDYLATVAAERAHGALVVEEAVIGWLTHVLDLLSRLVGGAMAERLVAQIGTPTPRGIAGPDPEDELDAEEA